jgi:hypothetical protein
LEDCLLLPGHINKNGVSVAPEDVNKTSLEVVSTAARPAVLRGSVSPPVGQWVKIAGRSGVFVVLRVDAEVGTADVLLLTGIRQIESGVQLGLMQTLGEQQRADLMKLPAAGELVGRASGFPQDSGVGKS